MIPYLLTSFKILKNLPVMYMTDMNYQTFGRYHQPLGSLPNFLIYRFINYLIIIHLVIYFIFYKYRFILLLEMRGSLISRSTGFNKQDENESMEGLLLGTFYSYRDDQNV